MKKTIIVILVVFALVAGFLAGCKTEVAETTASETTAAAEETTAAETTAAAEETTAAEVNLEDVTIGYVCKILDNPWFRPVTDSMQAVIESYGSKLIAVDAKMDPELYVTSIDNLIGQGVTVMMLTPPDQALSRVSVDKCEEAGIPVIAYADPLIEDGVKIAPVGELDGYQSGFLCGEALATYVVDNNILDGIDIETTGLATITTLSVSQFVPRTDGSIDGWKSVLPDYPESQYFTNDTKTSLTEEAYDSMNALITANPDIKTWFVLSANDESEVGAARALEVAGLDKTSYLWALGGYLAKDEWKKDFSSIVGALYIGASSHGEFMGETVMEWIITGETPFQEYIKEGDLFGTYPFTGVLVTPENYQEIMGPDAE